ncbi:MAG: 4-hydroxy-2-oxovalerate aldolase [Alphaproteobacteria bacterium]|nr:4-hydroxy-2-oxovalerate aldolase [Alphaproteobacteria bacterium]
MALRDGMHPKRHQISVDEMVRIATALDAAGVPYLEVTHGDGLGGASVTYGFPAASDADYLRAVVPRMTQARISALTLPGIGTIDELKEAVDCGVACLRVATHCTEADVAGQHLGMARDLGVEAVGFLMMAHMIPPEDLAAQARILEDFGAEVVYCTDSAGFMLPADVTARVQALRAALRPETKLGFHGHHNLAMGVANSLAALEAGVDRIDSSVAGLGAGAGNTPTEVLCAVLQRMGVRTGIDLYRVMDAAEDLVVPLMDRPVRIDRDALILGYAGVYSSFLLFAQRAAERYGVSSRDILVRMGELRTVGGQEDLIEDVAMQLARGG